jgi:hypothetical protein
MRHTFNAISSGHDGEDLAQTKQTATEQVVRNSYLQWSLLCQVAGAVMARDSWRSEDNREFLDHAACGSMLHQNVLR